MHGAHEWQEDGGVWRFRLGEVVLQISRAPDSCEDGRWFGYPVNVVRASNQPFVYMDLERAKLEMRDWLLWRLSMLFPPS